MYAVAGQVGGELYTIGVLQAYQADLIRDLNCTEGLSSEPVIELHRTKDFAPSCNLCHGCHRAASVAWSVRVEGERHSLSHGCPDLTFWTLLWIRKISEVKSVAFKHYMPATVRTLQSPLLTLSQVPTEDRKQVSLPGPRLRGGPRWQSCKKPKDDFRDVITVTQKSKSNPLRPFLACLPQPPSLPLLRLTPTPSQQQGCWGTRGCYIRILGWKGLCPLDTPCRKGGNSSNKELYPSSVVIIETLSSTVWLIK